MLPTCQAMLKLAIELLISGSSENNEFKFRAAVNRAYYSVFLLGRMKTGLENETKGVHGKVLNGLYPSLRNARRLTTYAKIEDLRSYREQADYVFPSLHPACLDWKNCAEIAVIQAEFALEHLEKLR